MKKSVSNVFWVTMTLIIINVILGATFPTKFQEITHTIQTYLTSTFGWYYLLLVSVIVIFCVFLIFSPIGKIRLSQHNEKPEYSRSAWFAMLFSAGMGIGLVFWGAAAPLTFYLTPPLAEPETVIALQDAMRFSFFHNGIHAWSIYALVALALAYFKFRKGAPGLISATLTPLFGDKMNGRWGQAVDVLAVFATVIGVATTLGFGAQQINGGLTYLWGVPNNVTVQALIIGVVTILFLISALSGLGKGIKYLSMTNLILAIGLLALVMVLGPTLFIFDMFTETIGSYFQNIVQMSFDSAPLDDKYREWINGWTIFYWAWWIAWSPFVGIFIARISKGRTIREFLIGVLLLPSLVSFIWYAVFGSTALHLQHNGLAALESLQTPEVLFGVFSQLPGSTVLSVLAIILIGTFFITSADSATYVLGMQTTYGSLNPSFKIKLVWGVALSTISIILLYSGGLQGLQNALIIAAFPFSIVMLLMVLSLYKALSQENKMLHEQENETNKSE